MHSDNSFLYSGMTSVSSEVKPTLREQQRRDREKERSKLKPAADVVLEDIARERASIYDMRKLFIDGKTTDEEIRAERLARAKYEIYLNRLEAKIRLTLSEKPLKRSRNG